MGTTPDAWHSPYLSYKIVDGIPRDRAERHPAPPAQLICRLDVCVRVKVVGHRDLRVLERWCDEANAEVLGGAWSEVFQESVGDVTEVDEEGKVA